MKISKKYLKNLVIETLEEIYVPGKETDTFVDPKTGKVTATAPKVTSVPRNRSPLEMFPDLASDEGEKQRNKNILKPFIDFVYNPPDFGERPPKVNILDHHKGNKPSTLWFLFDDIKLRRNSWKQSPFLIATSLNSQYGSGFSSKQIEDIHNLLEKYPQLTNVSRFTIPLYKDLGGNLGDKYVPSKEEELKGPKTVNIKRPGQFNEEKTKKTKIKYKCN